MSKKLLKVKPIVIYGNEGPVVAELVIVAKELSLPYELQPITNPAEPEPPFRSLLMYDPNGELHLRDSHAAVSYLVATYDDYLKISFRRDKDWFFISDQWHSIQVNLMAATRVFTKLGALGNSEIAAFFTREVSRGLAVLEDVLETNKHENIYMDDGQTPVTNGPWVVGNKMSYADLAICSWIYYLNCTSPRPVCLRWANVSAWFERVLSRGEVRATFASLMPRP
ncbi:hypothetical protein F5B17DRAFT_118980 [Nemania serpens]|nr:hypothetical protein F5B17DRAFT_118980 [Nemania serpens]